MYRTASPPLFDVPDYPSFRRVKPLPKRRRTSFNNNSDINDGINPNSPGIPTSFLPRSIPHSAYSSPAYPIHSSSQEIPRTQDTSPSVADTQRSQYDWRLPPDFFLPEEILRAAYALRDSRTAPRIDDAETGNSQAGDEQLFLPPRRKAHSLLNSASLPSAATPPPPSDVSTDDEELRDLQPVPYHNQYLRSPKDNSNREGLTLDEGLSAEGVEDDLQDRLFLRTETDRLLAHADSLSAKMALRSYYQSMGYGVPEFGSGAAGSPLPPVLDHIEPRSDFQPSNGNAIGIVNGTQSVSVASGNGYVAVGVGRSQDDGDGDGRGGDCVDHSSQQGQGNTKKRKVPTNVGNSPPHHHHHHQLHHYSSHRGAMGVYGSGAPTYGQITDVEGEELRFGFGFALDPEVESTANDKRFGATAGGVESDVFGPLSGPKGVHAPHRHSQLGSAQQFPTQQFPRKAKMSPATLAGLRRKELVKNRKKHIETLMGTLPTGDAWTLDHALLPNFPPLLSSFSSSPPSKSSSADSDNGHARNGSTFVRPDVDENWELGWGWNDESRKELRVRRSKRETMRIARSARMGLERLGRHPDAVPFPTGEFVFSYPSPTAERLASLQQEITKLRSLLGSELARQTAKAAQIASGPGKGGNVSGKTGKKRAQQRAKTTTEVKSGEQPAEFLEMPQKVATSTAQSQGQTPQASPNQSQGQTTTPKKGKKKKRSTMANASNPHHLRNYVPSRLPHAAGGGGSTGGANGHASQTASANTLWPLALKFLSADLPPRRNKQSATSRQNNVNVQTLPQLVVPQDEWICSFCEYSLFYGDEAEYRRALGNRKKVLKRRRRARERAAAAASGVNAAMKNAAGAPVAEKTQIEDDEEEFDDPGYEDPPLNDDGGRVETTVGVRPGEPPG